MMQPNGEKNLFLIRGIPGSSRGLVAAKLANPDYPVYSADDFFLDESGKYNFDGARLGEAHTWCQEQVSQAMRDNFHKIFVSNTFVEDWELFPYYNLARQYGYYTYYLIVENRHGGTTDKIPKHSSQRMRDKFSIRL